jgi:hypothetical protein
MTDSTLHGLDGWSRDLSYQQQGSIIAKAVQYCLGVDITIDIETALRDTADEAADVAIFNAFVASCEELLPVEVFPIDLENDAPANGSHVLARDPNGDFEWTVTLDTPQRTIILDVDGWDPITEKTTLPEWILNLVLSVFILEAPCKLTAWAPADATLPGDAGRLHKIDLPGAGRPFVQPEFYYLGNSLGFCDAVNSRREFWLGATTAAEVDAAKNELAPYGFVPY